MTALRRIPVQLRGDWQPVGYVGRVDWHGTAVADEPLTALALCRSPTATQWARAGRSGATKLAVKLSVRPTGSDSRHDVAIGLAIQPVGRGDSSGEARLQTLLRLSSTAPFMFSLDHCATGEETWFARVWSDEEVRLGAFFVAESDTRSARNHLWHLRKGLNGPNERLTEALAYGRTGEFRA